MLYVGLRFFGLPGAAVAFDLRTTGDCLLLMYFAGGLKEDLEALVTPALVLVPGFAVGSSLVTGTLMWWCLVTALLLLAGRMAWSNMPAETRGALLLHIPLSGKAFLRGDVQ